MNKESIMAGIIGVLAGVVFAGLVAGQAVNNNNSGMMRMMGMNTDKIAEHSNAANHGTMSMADMSKELEKLTGDDYDKAFIEMMISHHEGAVSMAKLSNTQAKHNEIKQLSQAVIAAQEKEIADMEKWQKDWGYASDEMMDMMHGSN